MAESDPNQEILHDFSPLLRVYKNGHIERLVGQQLSPASLDSDTGVLSKDILIDADTNLSARLYTPKSKSKLPLLLYFHGGAFVVASAFSTPYHTHLNLLTAKSQAIVLSVNYRLAPEHPIPAAYDDAWRALEWAASDEEISRRADLSRVFLGGDSSGANIAHNVAMRHGAGKTMKGVDLVGMFFNCPLFCGEEAVGEEESHPVLPKKFFDDLWRFVCPGTAGSDDPRINPSKDAKLGEVGCKRVLVYTAEMDTLKERAWLYKEALEKSTGWGGEIEAVEAKGEGHLFSVYDPTGENGMAMITKVAAFINH